jgi:DMSO/TMAO reductase YedYZ heme-binding membrane subunit
MTMELMMTIFIAIGMILVLLVYPIFFDDNGIDNGNDDGDSR